MPLTVSETELGTDEARWLAFAPLRACPRLEPLSAGRVVIVAPHPDDEVLAVGGLMHALASAGHELSIVAVTDGEASHPRSRSVSRARLAERRADERRAALATLGLEGAQVTCLHHPDGDVKHARLLATELTGLLEGAAYCVAPWERDGHPDHDAAGRAALIASMQAHVSLLQYPVWAWHWALPRGGEGGLPWGRARSVALSREVSALKRAAIAAYRSQIAPLGDGAGDEAVLPPAVLERFHRPFEIVFV